VSEHGYGLTTATKLQRAVSYVMCGVPMPPAYATDPEVLEAFGGIEPKPTPEVVVLAAIRCAKTLLACVGVTWASQHCVMPPGLRPGEIPRVSLVSRYTDQADAAFAYLKGAFMESPVLNQILLAEPTSERILVRHASGTPIEIMVAAGARSGTTLISRWMAGMIFDEAPRIASEADGVVNLKSMRSAVVGRMLPGTVVIYVGSPVGAIGDVYDMVQENWENPDQQITVVRATGPRMNPYWWTPERCEDLRKRDPDAHRTDVLAQFLDPEQNLFTSVEIERATRESGNLEREPGRLYTACMDPATRGNSWTFGIADTTDNRKYRCVHAEQWTGSTADPLSPKTVLTELVPTLKKFGIRTILTDQWAVDALRDIVRDLSKELDYEFELAPRILSATLKKAYFLGLKARFSNDAIELPKNAKLREDLLRVKKRINSGGEFSIVFTETADGRHADYAAMLAMLCGQYIEESPAESKATATDEGDEYDKLFGIEETLDAYQQWEMY